MCRGRDKNQSQTNVRLRRLARRGKNGNKATVKRAMGELVAEEVPRIVHPILPDYEKRGIVAVVSSQEFQNDLMSA